MAFKPLRCLLGHGQVPVRFLVNDSQTIDVGDVLQLTGGKVSVVSDAQTAGTVAGVAMESIITTTATSADIIAVDVNPFMVYRANYSGSATPAIGTAYDSYDSDRGYFDSDDSTGGYIMVQGNVDSTNKLADVLVSNRYNNVG